MTQDIAEKPIEEFWIYAVGSTILGILIGTLNRGIVAALLANDVFGRVLGFGVGGLIAGAIQGASARRYIHSRWAWISATTIGWLVLGIPEIWFPRNTIWYWACESSLRWALLGALGGAIVGVLQSLVLWRYAKIARWWIIMHILVWASILVLPIIFFESWLRGEGSCYY